MSFKRIESKVQLGTFYFNGTKIIASRCEVPHNIHVIDRVKVGNETFIVKDHLMELKAGDCKLLVTVEQGSGNVENNILVIATPKLKVVAMK